MHPLLQELRRRKVLRVAASYGVVAWLVVEVCSVVLPTFNAPEWPLQAITLLAILGFPLTVVLAWAFEWTPEGIKRDRDVDQQQAAPAHRKLNFAVVGVLAVALAASLTLHFINIGGDRPAGGSAARGKSVAVLPFTASAMSGETPSFLADGIQDDLLTLLARLDSLEVISRTSVNEYRDTQKNVRTIGEELGVANILEGFVQRAGDNVRIRVQLIDTATDTHLWAQSYDRQLTASNIFDIQSEIASEIARALEATLSEEERQHLATRPTENMDAYLEYTVGRQEMDKRTSGGLERAVQRFQRAVELDPHYALAHAALADAYNLLNDYGDLSLGEMLEKAVPALAEAMKIDDQLAEAFTSLANLRAKQGDIEWAEPVYQRALELNPNYTTTYLWYGGLLREALGRPEEALALHRKGLELDPRSALMQVNYAFDLLALGRFEEAQAALEKAIELDPQHPSAYAAIAKLHHVLLANPAEAIGWAKKALAIDPDSPGNAALLSLIYLDIGDARAAGEWSARALENGPENAGARFAQAMLEVYRRDGTAAVESARWLLQNDPQHVFALWILRNADLENGRAADARRRYAEAFPQLFTDEPEVNAANLAAAIDVAPVLLETGERERAERLLSGALRQVEALPAGGVHGPGIDGARALALLGRTAAAIEALQTAYAAGWRSDWWLAEIDPALASLRDEPGFKALMARLRDEMSAA
ncbi:MAG TPA: tetratricopeptide repeat protein, partial [Gammaproteobacteria bacterium]|nr:tetratricopeptide repeat protein [Gammaproteobacteria bacterium]